MLGVEARIMTPSGLLKEKERIKEYYHQIHLHKLHKEWLK